MPICRLTIICLLAASLAACHRDSTSAAINPTRRWQLYDIAWQRGFADRLTPRPNDWTRYHARLEPFTEVPERETIFRTGYDDGYHQHPEEERSLAEMAYDSGYRNGRQDAWEHKPSTPFTHTSGIFDREAFAKGYSEGFSGLPHAYQRPY